MKYQIYSIYDTAVESFMSPFFVKTEGEALRGFRDAAQNTDTPIGKHPADYHLFKIGEYTDHDGDLRSCPPVSIMLALEAIQTTQKD